MKTVAIVYGTRPETIKLAPLIVSLKNTPGIKTVVICTGQHKEMLEGILEIWGLKNDYLIDSNFNSSHSSAIPHLMVSLEKIFLEVSPDLVVVQGDTATATAGALQAHALHVQVAHVEAGLRSGDLWNPWPEESNRRIIDSIASLHFAPTKSAANNLEREGYGATTTVTGNTVVDALIHTSKELAGWLVNSFRRSGRCVSLNSPFSGSLVPHSYYHLDKRVKSVMIEVRRDIYMDEDTQIGIPGTFEATQEKIRVAIAGYCGIFESNFTADA